MALDFSSGGSMSYSSFGIMRSQLAKDVLGVNLVEMKGYGGSLLRAAKPGYKSWGRFWDHPLYPLFNQADNDGEISLEDLNKIIPVFDAWHKTLSEEKHGYTLYRARTFLEAMIAAQAQGEQLEFY